MKRLGYFLICVIFISISCTKTTQVHFHGRITFACNNQLPAKNGTVHIYRGYDTGSSQAEVIGETATNNEGYYDLIAEVRQKGNFVEYVANFGTGPGTSASTYIQFSGEAYSYDNDQDVELNGSAKNDIAYKFHIKNSSPFNSADVLNSFIVFNHSSPYNELTHIANLTGNVDTVIYQFYNTPKMNYNYSYTKNGVLTSVPADTLATPNCLDTISVNVFY